ncbi:SAC3 GANP family protein, putative [Babesia ovata]|uniref:SAC3 GANP family protein, putative n=1 Tax=Babesia ovata TaxID=189622 RepID=A0A2H6KHC3_9APIC|nr:SAC3 GANP family protein, putative [Babesia ovata]GBE62397.1 SAC3 GANP family protein, putative [Babesia ovata]
MRNTAPPVRQPPAPSYNMLFAFFKQQGYNDELAASEARRMMIRPPPPPAGPKMPPPMPGPVVTYNRASLLSGVKLTPKNAWRIPLSTTPVSTRKSAARNVIPITLKVSRSNEEPKARPGPWPSEPVHGSTAPTGVTSRVPPQFGSDIAIDVAPETGVSQPKKPYGPDVPTMDDINNWIQRMYSHHAMGACSKGFRAKISEFVERVVQRHRNGSLTTKDLVIPSPYEIMGTVEPVSRAAPNSAPNAASVAPPKPPPTRVSNVAVTSRRPLPAPRANAKSQAPSLDGEAFELRKRQQRSERFKSPPGGEGVYNFRPQKGSAVVGVCETLEKPYLRLTAEPNPAVVRPERVLRKAFRHVFDTFMRSFNYRYIEEQFRSIRQDVQVQHLSGPFVVKLYATNARIALVHGDLDQFNQCQTQLRHLHRRVDGFPQYQVGSLVRVIQGRCQMEFDCYFLLYLSMQNMHMDVLRYLRDALDSDFRASAYFRYADAIRTFLSEGNFVEYFRVADTSGIDKDACIRAIYAEAFATEDFTEGPSAASMDHSATVGPITTPPFYAKLLFKMFEPRFRMNALVAMASTAMSLSVDTVMETLRFGSAEDCIAFIRENGGTMNQAGLVDCRGSLEGFLSSPLLRNKKL